MKQLIPRPWLALVMAGVMLALPSFAAAQDDLGVTLRIVEDDQELDEEFVNQLEIPSSLEDQSEFGSDGLEPGIEDVAGDVRDEMLDLESTLGEQSRETRDALDLELTGELETDLPGLEAPELEDPDLENPDLGLPDLSTPELETLNTEE